MRTVLAALAVFALTACGGSGERPTATRSSELKVESGAASTSLRVDVCGLLVGTPAFREVNAQGCTNESAVSTDTDYDLEDWAGDQIVRLDWAEIELVRGGTLTIEVATCSSTESCESAALADLYKVRESNDAPPGASAFWAGTDDHFLKTKALVGDHIISGLSIEAGVDVAAQRGLISAVIEGL